MPYCFRITVVCVTHLPDGTIEAVPIPQPLASHIEEAPPDALEQE